MMPRSSSCSTPQLSPGDQVSLMIASLKQVAVLAQKTCRSALPDDTGPMNASVAAMDGADLHARAGSANWSR